MAIEINLQDFIDEAEDQIRVLNDGLLSLEKDENNEEIINEVFRAAHTLKGGSGLVGFTKLTELTHHLESIFDLIRDKKLALTSAHLDTMFEVLDVIMELMGEVDSGQFSTDIGPVSKKLKAILDAQKNAATTPIVAPSANPEPVKSPEIASTISTGAAEFIGRELTPDEANNLSRMQSESDPIYQIFIRISQDCDVASLFMFMIFNKINELGELILSNPPEDELENNEEFKEVRILFSSMASIDDIRTELQMPEVEILLVEPLQVETPEMLLEALFKEESIEINAPVVVDISIKEETVEKTVEPIVKNEEPVKKEAFPPPPVPAAKSALVAKEESAGGKSGSTTLRVDSTKIDVLLELAGELVINKTRFVQVQLDLEKILGKNGKTSDLKETVTQLMRISNELQESIMQLRMVAVDQVFSRFPRVVRDIANKLDKGIDLIVEGKDTELDKSVVEEIGDPLMHLVRNSVDHGIESKADRKRKGKPETGTVYLRAFHQGSSIVLEVQDDGKGLDIPVIKSKAVQKKIITEAEAASMSDKEAANLIFAPGFSTAEAVSDLSGRGVGMDVVKKNVERLNGVVEIVSEKDKGSTFTIKLPLTLAIISAMLVRTSRNIYAIPLVNVIEVVEVSKKDIVHIAKKEAISIRNETITILRLDEVLQLGTSNRDLETFQVVIVMAAGERIGFGVDSLIGEQDLVIKSLDSHLVECPGIAGASILGDASLALIVDVATLVEKVIAGIY